MVLGIPEETGENLISYTIPAPIGGINRRDSLALMPEEDAVNLENWFPDTDRLKIRKGYRYHSKTIGSGVVSGLAEYSYTTTTALIASGGSDNKIYNATTAQAAATDITGATTPQAPIVHFQQFKNRLFMCSRYSSLNDPLFHWDGSGNCGKDAYGVAVTGLGPMTVYKGRIYFSHLVDPNIAYSALDSTSGSTTVLPLGHLLKFGGSFLFLGNTTRAKDFSEDELFCLISSQGEILVFSGDYPADPNWQLIGHYYIPKPLGPRAFFYIGPDLQIITRQGVIPMSSVMKGLVQGRYTTISDKMARNFSDAATDSLMSDIYWTGINYPKGNYALVNVPVTSGSISNQYVMNTLSGAWTVFSNQNAFSWTLFNDNLYFGTTNGRVMRADYINSTNFDEDPANEGQATTPNIDAKQAFNYLGDRTRKKSIKFLQPVLYTAQNSFPISVNVDFEDTSSTNQGNDPRSATTERFWSPLIKVQGVGRNMAIRSDWSGNIQCDWHVTNVFYQKGGIR